MIPKIKIDTSWAYSKFKNVLDTSKSSTNFPSLFDTDRINTDKLKLIENDFESIVIPAYPEIGKIKQSSVRLALSMPVCQVQMTVFGIFNDNVY